MDANPHDAPFAATPNACDCPLWAVTCLFGDHHGGRRLANYREFRRRLPVPLAAVELTFQGPPLLQPGDADLLIQLTDGDPMWQKERLLNLAMAQLPAACRYVAWLDSDVVLRRPDWPGALCHMLDEYPFVHMFERVLDCPRGADPDAVTPAAADGVSHSFAWRWRHGRLGDELRSRENTRIERDCASGMAWAARRDVLDALGLYDACIAGAGDRVLGIAMLGQFDDAIYALRMTEPYAQHYLRWARPVYDAVRGRVGCLPGDVVHLWHGPPRQRRHAQRHVVLNEAGYDPDRDIALRHDGSWRFATDKPDVRRFFCDYFDMRHQQELQA